MSQATQIRLAAITLFLGVTLGAFGAHGLHDLLVENGRTGNWETATLYHLVHGIAMLTIALSPQRSHGFNFMLVGIFVFCGSLYLLAVTNITKLGAITPLGGVCFLIAWTRWIFFRESKH